MTRAAFAGPLIATIGACAAAAPPAPAPSEPLATASVFASSEPACPSSWSPASHPAPAGSSPTLPSPALPSLPIRIDDAYTVRGALHDFRSRAHADEITRGRITLIGYVVRTNFADAPRCALHAPGKADGPTCVAPLPSFAIGDTRDATETLDVLGWASRWSQLVGLQTALARAPKHERDQVKRVDEVWGVELPNPLPSVGAKVRITGTYGAAFALGSAEGTMDPRRGIVTAVRVETLEAGVEVVRLGR